MLRLNQPLMTTVRGLDKEIGFLDERTGVFQRNPIQIRFVYLEEIAREFALGIFVVKKLGITKTRLG